ncbi:MAG: major capsid protein, partial [Acidobacteriota bacterium]
NLVMRIQGEYAYNLRLRGFAWDVTNGGANPTDSALGTSTNWDKAATADKSLAGIRIKTQ